MDADAFEKAIAGQEAVINAFGAIRPPVHMMETSAKNILAGMKGTGMRRLIQPQAQVYVSPKINPISLTILLDPCSLF